MKKRKILLAALLLCFSVSLQVNAKPSHETEVGTVDGQTYSGYSDVNGGAIYTAADEEASVTNSTFTDNTADRGGAVYNAGKLTVGGTFEGNSAQYTGGAIDNRGTLYVEDGSIFRNNTTLWTKTTSDPGGTEMGTIYSSGSKDKPAEVNIGNNVTFENNKADGGAGLYLYGSNNAKIGNGVTFKGNKANSQGGAITFGYDSSGALGTSTLTIGDNATFDGNEASIGGAISVNGVEGTSLEIGDGAVFKNNSATGSSRPGYGGAIYVNGNNSVLGIGEGSVFESNSAKVGGGAIFNTGNMGTLKGASFTNNSSGVGGAVYVTSFGKLDFDSTLFKGNTAGQGGAIVTEANMNINNSAFDSNTATNGFGGAIYNTYNSKEGDDTGNVALESTDFINNSAQRGGAIYGGADTTTSVNGGTFSGNNAIGTKDTDGNPAYGQGGAIFTDREGTTLEVKGANFEGNTAQNEGGAIWSGSETYVSSSTFKNNSTKGTEFGTDNGKPNYKAEAEGGGAIFVGSNSTAVIESSNFVGNKSATVGGAVATRSNASPDGDSSLVLEGNTFSENSAAKNGGAIASYVDTEIIDTSFTNNSAGEKGGAIWANGDVTVKAENKDIVFSGNSSADGGDIYMDKLGTEGTVGALELNAGKNKNITIGSGVSGAEKYDMNLTGDGEVTVKSEIKNANMQVTKGTLHLAEGNVLTNTLVTMSDGTTLDTIDGAFTSYSEEVIKSDGNNITLKADISSATGKSDSFKGITSENVTLADFNPIGDTLLSSGSITIEQLKETLGLGENTKLAFSEEAQKEHTFLTPLRYITAKADKNGISFSPVGNRYQDFNPAVMASPVAAQLGGYLTQLNSYDEAFRNMDMYMLMTKSQRQAMKNRNKYAASDSNLVFDPTNSMYDNASVWARPYATFENVPLKNGPKVSNVAWGSFFGADSDLVDLGNGWDGMFGAYIGYNGSHQAFDGISIYQNGATLGLVGMAYKDNYFAGLTANIGSNIANADTIYGSDDFTLLMSGIAAKTGYNWELADGKFIIQPSYLMSYSFVNTFDYTNAAGIRIDSDPLHAIQIEPGIKFIGNLANGWQPYAGVSFVWNIMDKTQFQASDATLPELSVKPFVKYGIGVRKTWGERITGFFQTFFTSGGRNGVGLQAGFRYSLGSAKAPKHANSTGERKFIKANNTNKHNNII